MYIYVYMCACVCVCVWLVQMYTHMSVAKTLEHGHKKDCDVFSFFLFVL